MTTSDARAAGPPELPDLDPGRYDLAGLTSDGFAALVTDSRPFVILLPVGSVEPHGPHMSLVTDTVISRGACEWAAQRLEQGPILARIAPSVAYGVTECAAGFAGAVSVPAEILTDYLGAVMAGFLRTGSDHVCLVNNHLEPDHDRAVRAAARRFRPTQASVACPLTRRWARTLSDEFKSGACHAGRYETSIVMARAPALVDNPVRRQLADVPISLSDQLRAGISDFAEMGLSRAYAGAPAQASAAEGHDLLDLLADMIATEVADALASRG